MTGLEVAGIAGIAGIAEFVGIELPTLALVEAFVLRNEVVAVVVVVVVVVVVAVVETVAGAEEDMETGGRRN